MRALVLHSRGDPGSLALSERPRPEPGPGQVRVRVAAAALNHVDLYMIDSGAGIRHSLPLTLGVDVAGTVEATGPGVAGWTPGQAVLVYPAQTCGHCEFCRRGEQMLCLECRIIGEHIDGGFAESVCVQAACLFPVPAGLDFEAAAALPVAYLTAWRMLMTQAGLRAGETVLIHGVGGGVALAALQIAVMAGARAVVTSGEAAKLERALALGAEAAVGYRDGDVLRAVMDFTAGRGVDVVIDNVGGPAWGLSLRAARRGGRVVTCGATAGPNPGAELQRVFIRQLRIFGSTLGTYEEFRALLAAAGRGAIAPVIDRIYPLAQAPEALERLRQGRQFGKLVLRVGEG